MRFSDSLERLHSADREQRQLERVVSILHWDMETNLPPQGVDERAEQLALLQGMAHRRLTEPETGRLLGELGSTAENPSGDGKLPAIERDFLRVTRRRYDKAVRLPQDFVSDSARAEGLSQAAWAAARMNNDFAAFLPHLETMIGIARRKADYWGSGTHPYDGLLDVYEPGMGAAEIGTLFSVLRERLGALLRKIQDRDPPDSSFLRQDFPLRNQKRFCQKLLVHLGFDQQRGRLDTSPHPFATTLGSHDVRITTRYFRDNLPSSLFSVIHESGHAMYEMGFPPELRGGCLADGASMAIHESQSRLWENVIGRSLPFWEGLYPQLKGSFPDQLAGVDVERFYRAVNEARPSLIRVDADEVSYSLHIILRFELEQGLISGDLAPERLPQVWREKTREYLGLDIDPADPRCDADGVLQDIHWSMGAFGYFPSYALGNLYGLQFFRKLESEVPDIAGLVAGGQFSPIRDWLRDNIYAWGCRLEPARLLERVTGEKLRVEPFLDYIEEKYV
jgi:carboxypeptidase Taq